MTKRTLPWRKIFQYGVPLLLTALWLGFIFGNSLQNGVESGNQSHAVQELLNAMFQRVGLQNPISEGMLRKLAHFGEFAILATLYIGDLMAFGQITLSRPLKRSLLWFLSAVPVCFAVAGIDEFLQRFSAGRAPQFSDMLIDTSGAACAALLCCAVFLLIRYIDRNRFKPQAQKHREDKEI